MTRDTLIAIINAHSGKEKNVLGVFFDNDVVEYYLLNKSNPDNFLDASNIVNMGGEDVLKMPLAFANKTNGARDIKGYRYVPLDMIQAVITLDNADDIERLDVNKFFVN